MSHSQLLVLVLLTIYSFSIFVCKEYNQSDFGVDDLVMSIYTNSKCFSLLKLYTLSDTTSQLCSPKVAKDNS